MRLSRSSKRTLPLLLAFPLLWASSSSHAQDYTTFVSEEHRFSMQYPATWTRGDLLHPQSVIRLESPDGDDYVVSVVKNSALRNTSPSDYVDALLPQMNYLVDEIITQNYPDAHLVDKGKTLLSQQPAAYMTFDYTLSAAGIDIPMRGYSISTVYDSKEYSLGFRGPQRFFDDYMPTIQILALGFQFTKSTIQSTTPHIDTGLFGTAIAILMLSGLLACIPAGFYSLINRPMNSRQFLCTMGVVAILLILGHFASCYLQNQESETLPTTEHIRPTE